jgi:glycosyltransferase involved in cell wall biosynthesis
MTETKNADEWVLKDVIAATAIKPVLKDMTIIIPTLGRPIFETCLKHIVSGSHWPGALIVIHQGDDPEIEAWTLQMRETGIEVVYVHSAERGKPRAINMAFARTPTRFACLIDDDCFVHPEWLLNMHNNLQTHPDWIITGRVEPAGNETVAVVQLMDAVVYSRPRIMSDLFVGGNFGAAMVTIRRVGPFDEDPLLRNAAEDVEWGYRALKQGISIAYAPEVVVSHFGWRAENEKNERFKVYAYGHGGFYGKYLRRGDMFIFLRALIHFGRAFRRWVFGSIRGNADFAMNGKAYCMGLIPGIVAGFRSKIHPQKLL